MKLIISNNARRGQIVVVGGFALIDSLILYSAIHTHNYPYLFTIVLSTILFLSFYIYSLRFRYIYLENEFFYLSNILQKDRVHQGEFDGITPMKGAFLPLNNPYFTISFKNGKKYDFSNQKVANRNLFSDRNRKAGIINKLIVDHISKNKVG